MESDIGRDRAIEYSLFSKPAEILANRIPADAITVVGAAAGVVGSYFMSLPEQAAGHINEITNGKLKPTKNQIKLAGAAALGMSYVCDLLDGAVARKSDSRETFHGTIFDGVANKIVDTSPSLFFLSQTKSKSEKAIWLSFLFAAPLATIIRSRGLSRDLPVSKTGLGARASRVPVLLAGLVWESKRDLSGKILILQAASSMVQRYQKIRNSGDTELLEEVNRDALEYTALFFAGMVMGNKRFPKELLAVGLELAKLTQVKVNEARRGQVNKNSHS